MKTVHEFLITNKRTEDSRFEYSWFYSWMVACFAGVVARVESLRGQNSPFEARESERQVDGLFESLLSEAFHG
jgi:hypothetical protein